jgi:hypothetical protein
MTSPKELAEQHAAIARHEARRLGRGEEGLSECYLALVEAACEWDPTADVPFEAWARHLIRLRTRRRLSDQRIITVPWRVRSRLAELIDELDKEGKGPLEPSLHPIDPTLFAAIRAITVRPIPDGAEIPEQEELSLSTNDALPEWARLRYGYDGLGLKTVKEVASMLSMETHVVLALDAALLSERTDQ